MKRLIIFTCVLGILALGSRAQTETKIDRPYITTVGTAEVVVIPDIATISVSVKNQAKTVASAKSATDAQIAKIVSVAKQFGVVATDVRVDYITIKEVYVSEPVAGSNLTVSKFDGYTVGKTLAIRLKQVNRYDEFLTELINSGVSQIGGVEFESSEMRKYKDEARAKAVRAAREKAVRIAREIGQTVGKALIIEERDVDRWNNPRANYSSNSFSDDEDTDDSVAAFSVGAITIKAQVEVRFVLN